MGSAAITMLRSARFSHGTAIGHGKGYFSAEGIRIAVDHFRNNYNATHKNLKVLVPITKQG